MHMSDALITPVVGGTMLATSTGVVGYSIRNLKSEMFERRLPLMGVMGAFLFAAQMINFSIPGTGSSGHIGGGMLLAILLGPGAGFLTMASVLMIQALFFADGGILAFGCNLINLGFFTCYLAYPLIYKTVVKNNLNKRRIMIGAVLASVVGLQMGSLGVVAETYLSGRTELELNVFLLFMQTIHLAIGLIEGVITGVIVNYLFEQHPSYLYKEEKEDVDIAINRKVIGRILAAALVVGGMLSLFASASPDGLEWAIERTVDSGEIINHSPVVSWIERLQSTIAPMPDYGFREPATAVEEVGTSTAGLIGSLITLMMTLTIGMTVRKMTRTRVISNE